MKEKLTLKQAERQFLTITQLADVYGVSRTSVYKWLKLGMPYSELATGGGKRFELNAVRDWSDNRPKGRKVDE